MAKLIPDIRGPKLPEFQGDLKDIEFVSLLSPSQQNSSSENEYETDPEYIAAVPAAEAEPLSVYDVIPDEDGGTVIPNSPMRQKDPRQLPSPRRPQGKHDSRLLTT